MQERKWTTLPPVCFFQMAIWAVLTLLCVAMAHADDSLTYTERRNLAAFKSFEDFSLDLTKRESRNRIRLFLQRFPDIENPGSDELLRWAVAYTRAELGRLQTLRSDCAQADSGCDCEAEWIRLAKMQSDFECRIEKALGPDYSQVPVTPAVPSQLLRNLHDSVNDGAQFKRLYAQALLLGADQSESKLMTEFLALYLNSDASSIHQEELLRLALASPSEAFRNQIAQLVCDLGKSTAARVVFDVMLSAQIKRGCGNCSKAIADLIVRMSPSDFLDVSSRWTCTLEGNELVWNLAFDKSMPDELRAAIAVRLAGSSAFVDRVLEVDDPNLFWSILREEFRSRRLLLPDNFDFNSVLSREDISAEEKRLVVQVIGQRAKKYSGTDHNASMQELVALERSNDAVVRSEASEQKKRAEAINATYDNYWKKEIREGEARLEAQIETFFKSIRELQDRPRTEHAEKVDRMIWELKYFTWMSEIGLLHALTKRLHLDFLQSNSGGPWRTFLSNSRSQFEERKCSLFTIDEGVDVTLDGFGHETLAGFADCESRVQDWELREGVPLDFVIVIFENGEAGATQYATLVQKWNEAMVNRSASGKFRVELPKQLIEKGERIPLLDCGRMGKSGTGTYLAQPKHATLVRNH